MANATRQPQGNGLSMALHGQSLSPATQRLAMNLVEENDPCKGPQISPVPPVSPLSVDKGYTPVQQHTRTDIVRGNSSTLQKVQGSLAWVA